MARIRSIKPEFWADGTNLELSDSCALFFIGLWNFCDDEGKHPLNLKQLVAELGGRWHVGKVKLFVSCLVKTGQLRINSDSTWIQLTGWSHQKIDKPKQPDVKASDLQWLSHDDSTIALERSRGFGARIGSDRRDRIGSDRLQEADPKPKSKSLKEFSTAEAVEPELLFPTANQLVWESYSTAYAKRYGGPPPRNVSVNSKISQFTKRVPETDAPAVAEFYLTHNDSYYVRQMHPVGSLLRDSEKLYVEWKTNRKMTGIAARNAESTQALDDQVQRIMRGEL